MKAVYADGTVEIDFLTREIRNTTQRRLAPLEIGDPLGESVMSFVTAPPPTQPNGTSQPVAGTNNEAERTLRGPAAARDSGRANKSTVGARRQTIIVSVLESLRLYLPTFTLASVIAEINRWWQAGQSCFTKLLKKMKLQPRAETILDKVMPAPDG